MMKTLTKIFLKLDRIGSAIFYAWDSLDLTTLLGYGPWFIFGIWAIFESRGDMPIVLAIFFVMIMISVCGAVTTFIVSVLKIVLMGMFIPVQKIAAWLEIYEDRTTGIGPYIEADKKTYGDYPSHAKMLNG